MDLRPHRQRRVQGAPCAGGVLEHQPEGVYQRVERAIGFRHELFTDLRLGRFLRLQGAVISKHNSIVSRIAEGEIEVAAPEDSQPLAGVFLLPRRLEMGVQLAKTLGGNGEQKRCLVREVIGIGCGGNADSPGKRPHGHSPDSGLEDHLCCSLDQGFFQIAVVIGASSELLL